MDPLLASLREADRRAYLAVLLAPAAKREALTTLASYGVELARVPLSVSEPMAGEFRLQWWAEVARGERDGEAAAHPIASRLVDLIATEGLPREPIAAMAEARTHDLYADPMPDTEAFETYAGETASLPIQTACLILDGEAAGASATAAGHAGIYLTVIDRLATLARDRAAGRVFLPADLLLKGWTSPADLIDPRFGTDTDAESPAAVVREALDYATTHREAFTRALATLPASLAPAFAPAHERTVRERMVASMGAEILTQAPPESPLREQRAVMRTPGLFAPGTSLFGRLRERLVGRPG